MLPGLFNAIMMAAGGGGPISLSFLSGNEVNTVANHSSGSISFGDAHADRHIIVAFMALDGLSDVVTGVTIGGVSAVITGNAVTLTPGDGKSYNLRVGFAIARVPSGTTGSINFAHNQLNNIQYYVFRAVGGFDSLNGTLSVDGVNAINVAARSVSISVPAGGIAVGVAFSNKDSADLITWSGLTERNRQTDGAENCASEAAGDQFAEAVTLTVTATNSVAAKGHVLGVSVWR